MQAETISSTRQELDAIGWRDHVLCARHETLQERVCWDALRCIPGRITVITVCFNAVEKIGAAMASVRAQKHPDVEYIVIDGASTDGTLDLILENQENVALALSARDRGIADAFNRGVSLASGEFIAFINADDVWPDDHLQECLAHFKSRPESQYVYGDLVRLDEVEGSAYVMRGDPDFADKLRDWPPEFNHPSFVVRRSCFEISGLFSRRFRVCMDLDWLIRIHQAGLIGSYCDRVWVVMRCGGVSDNARRMYADVYDILIASGIEKWRVRWLWTKATLKFLMREFLGYFFAAATIIRIRSIFNSGVDQKNDHKLAEAVSLMKQRAAGC